MIDESIPEKGIWYYNNSIQPNVMETFSNSRWRSQQVAWSTMVMVDVVFPMECPYLTTYNIPQHLMSL